MRLGGFLGASLLEDLNVKILFSKIYQVESFKVTLPAQPRICLVLTSNTVD